MIREKVRQTISRFTPKRDETKRVVLVDFLKGLIILLMVMTHVIALTFDYTKTDNLVGFIGLIGGITSFTGFLFLSGVNSYFSFVGKQEEPEKRILKIFGKDRDFTFDNCQLICTFKSKIRDGRHRIPKKIRICNGI